MKNLSFLKRKSENTIFFDLSGVKQSLFINSLKTGKCEKTAFPRVLADWGVLQPGVRQVCRMLTEPLLHARAGVLSWSVRNIDYLRKKCTFAAC